MSVVIQLNESTGSRRVVPLPPLVQSNGTSACTNESGRTFFFSVGGIDYGSGGSISAISAAAGLYECLFSASKVSVLGQGRVYYSSGTALPASTPIEIVAVNSYDSMRLGLFALPNAAAEAAGGLITFGTGTGQMHTSSGSVGLKAQTHSQATVLIAAGDYSSIVTVGVGNIKAATYSGVTVGTNNIAAGTYSGVTIQGVSNSSAAKDVISDITGGVWYAGTRSNVTIQGISNYANISNVTLAAGTHSNVTIQGISNYANISNVTLAAGTHSNVTIQGVTRVNSSVTIANATYSAVTVRLDAVDYSSIVTVGVGKINQATGQDIADRTLLRNIASGSDGGRDVRQALYVLRNRTLISGSTGTTYQVDDSTSAFTFSVATVAAQAISEIDPGGT